MQLTEQHIVKSNEWRHWCVKAKDLYNQSLYYWRQSVFGEIESFTEYELTGLYAKYNEPTYRALPANTSQQIVKYLFNNIKCWMVSKKEWKNNPSMFTGRPNLPKYKKELSELYFTPMQVKLKNGYVHFPKMIGISPIKTNIDNIQQCRVIPKSNHFVVEFIYNVADVAQKHDNGRYFGVDLGINNIISCISNGGESFLISGKPLKSINQFYNKRIAKLRSSLVNNQLTSKRIQRLSLSRNNKIKNYIHHISKCLVNKAAELNITKIVIGNNKNWKQNINIGKRNNQNFTSIPYSYLINTIEYKANMAGIEVIKIEESYTSKCSAMDSEAICKHEIYIGKRVKRGLFRTANGTKINADINGATNILRKVVGDDFVSDSIWSAVVAPVKVSIF